MGKPKLLVDEMYDGLDEELKNHGYEAYSVKKLKVEGKKMETDFSVISHAKENGLTLVTQDSENIKGCRENNLPLIAIDIDDVLKMVLEKLK